MSTILSDCTNVYKKTFKYALLTWTLFLLGTGFIAWIIQQSGPHLEYQKMIFGAEASDIMNDTAHQTDVNIFMYIIYLIHALKAAMVLFAPLLGGYLFTMYKADHAQELSVRSLFSFYRSKTGVILIFLSLAKALIMLVWFSVGLSNFILFPFITLFDSLFVLAVFMSIHPKGQSFWRRLLIGWIFTMGLYCIFLMVCALLMGLIELISMAFQKPMNQESWMIFISMTSMVVVAAVYLLYHFYFSSMYVCYERFVWKGKNRDSNKIFTASL